MAADLQIACGAGLRRVAGRPGLTVWRSALVLVSLLVGLVHAGPNVESWQTSVGAKVMYVHAPDLPMVDVRVVFDAGSARDHRITCKFLEPMNCFRLRFVCQPLRRSGSGALCCQS